MTAKHSLQGRIRAGCVQACAARRRGRAVLILGALAAVLAAPPAVALSFFPERVVLDDQHRSAVLRIVNKSDTVQRYLITWRPMRMTSENGLRPVPEGDTPQDLYPAKDYVLFAPRQAAIPPNSTQAVRLMAQLPAELPPGEYRSHLMITEPPREVQKESSEDGVNMRIKVVSRTTLPVIVRHGDPQVDVSLESMDLNRTEAGPALDVTLGRSGGRSVYAAAEVTWEAPDGSTHNVFGPATLAVYREIGQREFTHSLDLPEGRTLKGGKLHYVVTRRPAYDDPATVLIDRRYSVP